MLFLAQDAESDDFQAAEAECGRYGFEKIENDAASAATQPNQSFEPTPSARLDSGVRRMRTALIVPAIALLLSGCAPEPAQNHVAPNHARLAEQFIDAFYSFDAARLNSTLSSAEASKPCIAYYQGWAEGGSYKVVSRFPCVTEDESTAACAVTVEDDFIEALRWPENATDSFRLTFKNGVIVGVKTSSNDPPAFQSALEWVKRERPEIVSGVCQGFFNGGPTPKECARAVARAFS